MEEMNKKAPEAAEKQTKAVKPAKKDKKPLGERMGHFFRSYASEIKKIVWCPWKQVRKNSLVVLVVVIAVAVAVCALDYGFSTGLAALHSLF